MYKLLLASLLLCSPIVNATETLYIGTFYQKDLKNHYPLYSLNDINNFINTHQFNKRDTVVFTGGVEISCSSYKQFPQQLNILSKKVSKIKIVKNYSCLGVGPYLQYECSRYENCEMIEPYNVDYKD